MSRSLVRARGALAAGSLQQALQEYRAHLHRHPTDAAARRELRQVQRTLQALAERARGPAHQSLLYAVADAVRMVKIDPQTPWTAVEYLEDLLALDPGSVEALVKLAEAANCAGASEPAMQALLDALSLDPNHAPALRLLGGLSAARGQLGRARACLRRLARLRPGDPEAQLLAREAEALHGQARVRHRVACALGDLPGPIAVVEPPSIRVVSQREDPARVPLAFFRPPRPSDSGWIVPPRGPLPCALVPPRGPLPCAPSPSRSQTRRCLAVPAAVPAPLRPPPGPPWPRLTSAPPPAPAPLPVVRAVPPGGPWRRIRAAPPSWWTRCGAGVGFLSWVLVRFAC